jgi:hypothetical protein
MATSAGTIAVKVVPDLSGFTEELLDALAEKVAARIIEACAPTHKETD